MPRTSRRHRRRQEARGRSDTPPATTSSTTRYAVLLLGALAVVMAFFAGRMMVSAPGGGDAGYREGPSTIVPFSSSDGKVDNAADGRTPDLRGAGSHPTALGSNTAVLGSGGTTDDAGTAAVAANDGKDDMSHEGSLATRGVVSATASSKGGDGGSGSRAAFDAIHTDASSAGGSDSGASHARDTVAVGPSAAAGGGSASSSSEATPASASGQRDKPGSESGPQSHGDASGPASSRAGVEHAGQGHSHSSSAGEFVGPELGGEWTADISRAEVVFSVEAPARVAPGLVVPIAVRAIGCDFCESESVGGTFPVTGWLRVIGTGASGQAVTSRIVTVYRGVGSTTIEFPKEAGSHVELTLVSVDDEGNPQEVAGLPKVSQGCIECVDPGRVAALREDTRWQPVVDGGSRRVVLGPDAAVSPGDIYDVASIGITQTLEEDETWHSLTWVRIPDRSAVLVPSGRTLTIEEGVVVTLGHDARIIVEGTLTVLGTHSHPVLLLASKSAESGRTGWSEVSISGDSTSFASHMWMVGGGIGVTTSRRAGGSNSEPVVRVAAGAEFTMVGGGITDCVGKSFFVDGGHLNATGTLFARVDTGGSVQDGILHMRDAHVVEIPDGLARVRDSNNDGLKLVGLHPSGEPSVIERTVIMFVDEDGIDQESADMVLRDLWVEGALRVGLAFSGNERSEVSVEGSVVRRCYSAIEVGFGHPIVDLTNCLALDSYYGLRHGDKYTDRQQLGVVTLTNTLLIDNVRENLRVTEVDHKDSQLKLDCGVPQEPGADVDPPPSHPAVILDGGDGACSVHVDADSPHTCNGDTAALGPLGLCRAKGSLEGVVERSAVLNGDQPALPPATPSRNPQPTPRPQSSSTGEASTPSTSLSPVTATFPVPSRPAVFTDDAYRLTSTKFDPVKLAYPGGAVGSNDWKADYFPINEKPLYGGNGALVSARASAESVFNYSFWRPALGAATISKLAKIDAATAYNERPVRTPCVPAFTAHMDYSFDATAERKPSPPVKKKEQFDVWGSIESSSFRTARRALNAFFLDQIVGTGVVPPAMGRGLHSKESPKVVPRNIFPTDAGCRREVRPILVMHVPVDNIEQKRFPSVLPPAARATEAPGGDGASLPVQIAGTPDKSVEYAILNFLGGCHRWQGQHSYSADPGWAGLGAQWWALDNAGCFVSTEKLAADTGNGTMWETPAVWKELLWNTCAYPAHVVQAMREVLRGAPAGSTVGHPLFLRDRIATLQLGDGLRASFMEKDSETIWVDVKNRMQQLVDRADECGFVDGDAIAAEQWQPPTGDSKAAQFVREAAAFKVNQVQVSDGSECSKLRKYARTFSKRSQLGRGNYKTAYKSDPSIWTPADGNKEPVAVKEQHSASDKATIGYPMWQRIIGNNAEIATLQLFDHWTFSQLGDVCCPPQHSHLFVPMQTDYPASVVQTPLVWTTNLVKQGKCTDASARAKNIEDLLSYLRNFPLGKIFITDLFVYKGKEAKTVSFSKNHLLGGDCKLYLFDTDTFALSPHRELDGSIPPPPGFRYAKAIDFPNRWYRAREHPGHCLLPIQPICSPCGPCFRLTCGHQNGYDMLASYMRARYAVANYENYTSTVERPD